MKVSSRAQIAALVAFALLVGPAALGVTPKQPTAVITFNSMAKAVYGDPDQTLAFSQTGGSTTITSNSPDICSVIGNAKVRILGAGLCKLVATNPGDPWFKPARAVSRSFLISKAPNLITISDFAWLSMANPTALITTTQTSGVTSLSASPSTICRMEGNLLRALKIGTCSVRATSPSTSNYLTAKTVYKTVKIALTSSVMPPQVNQVGPWTIRQLSFNDSNSFNDTTSAASWVTSGWFKAGLGFRIAQLEVLSTTRVTYLLKDGSGNPAANKVLNLSIGKRYAGSNAIVQVGNQSTAGIDKSPADQLLVTGTTDAQGQVSFDIKGLDSQARNGLYTQIAAWVTDMALDTIDIINLEYSIPSSGGSGPITPNPNLAAPQGPIDSLFYQPCTGITLVGQIAAISTDPTNPAVTALAVTRGRPDAPSGLWDYSVLATLPEGSFVSSGSKIVTVQVYSPLAGTPMRLRVHNTRSNYTKFVETEAVTTKANQWETLTFDFGKLASGSQAISSTTTYSTLSLIIEPGKASTGQKYFFKNFNIPGALIGKTALTTTSTSPSMSTAPGANGSYLWSEEFNGAAKSRPNSSAWKYALDWNNFIQGTQPDLVEMDGNGNLNLGMQKCADGTWNGGIIHTLGKKAFLYGKIEARIKIAQDPGWFSAFYMFGENVSNWPMCGEIDIQEAGPWNDFSSSGTIHGNYPNTTNPWNGGGGFSTKVPSTRAALSAGFNTFGILWTPTSITFTLNDVPYRTLTKAQVLKDGGTWPFDNPEFLVFSLYPYVASLPANTAPGTVLRGQVLVDWIRYSQYQGYGQVFDR